MRTVFVVLCLAAAVQANAECSVDVEVGDTLAFSVQSIEVPASCDEVTVVLKHTGTLPAAAMGHNWVLTKADDFQPVASAGISAGLEGNYLPANDERIIAATRIIGGGEDDSVTFSTGGLESGASYTFFCSFPGHWSVMKGSFTIT